MSDVKRWRGLASLVRDAIEHGSRAVEKIHLTSTTRTFAILEQIPSVDSTARVVHAVHDVAVGSVYGGIRLVNRVVGATVHAALSVRSDRE